MTKLFNFLKQLLFNLWHFRSIQRTKSINKKLKAVVVNQDKERTIFLNEFKFYLRKYLRKDDSGKYIPLKGKNKAEIYSTIMALHGDKLKDLNIKFTQDLRLKL